MHRAVPINVRTSPIRGKRVPLNEHVCLEAVLVGGGWYVHVDAAIPDARCWPHEAGIVQRWRKHANDACVSQHPQHGPNFGPRESDALEAIRAFMDLEAAFDGGAEEACGGKAHPVG